MRKRRGACITCIARSVVTRGTVPVGTTIVLNGDVQAAPSACSRRCLRASTHIQGSICPAGTADALDVHFLEQKSILLYEFTQPSPIDISDVELPMSLVRLAEARTRYYVEKFEEELIRLLNENAAISDCSWKFKFVTDKERCMEESHR